MPRSTVPPACVESGQEILLMRATTKVDGHVNVLSEQINGSQLYRGKL